MWRKKVRNEERSDHIGRSMKPSASIRSRVLPAYRDRVRLWADELQAWMPNVLFDTHVHIGPAGAVGPITPERGATALTTFTILPFEELLQTYAELYHGKTISGLVAFPFPQREIDYAVANDYLIEVMRRYVRHEQFLDFLDTGILREHPSLYLEMSSASCPAVYERVLDSEDLHSRLLFGSDLPFGMITGVERWSPTHGAIFLARDEYPWSDRAMNVEFASERAGLTYKTYHCIKAFKDALERKRFDVARKEQIKQDVFHNNAVHLFA